MKMAVVFTLLVLTCTSWIITITTGLNISLSVPPTSVGYGDLLPNITCSAPLDQVYELHFSLMTSTNNTKLLSFATKSKKTDGVTFVVDPFFSNLVEKPTVTTTGNTVHFTINSWAIFKRNLFVCDAIPIAPGQKVRNIYEALYKARISVWSWSEPSHAKVGKEFVYTSMCPIVRTKKVEIKYSVTKKNPDWTAYVSEFKNDFGSQEVFFTSNKRFEGGTSEYNYTIVYKDDGFLHIKIKETAVSKAQGGSAVYLIYCYDATSNRKSYLRLADTIENEDLATISISASRTLVLDDDSKKITPLSLTCEINTDSLWNNETIQFAYIDKGTVGICNVTSDVYGKRRWNFFSTNFDLRMPGVIKIYGNIMSLQLTVTGFTFKTWRYDFFCQTPRLKSTLAQVRRVDFSPKAVPFPVQYSDDPGKVFLNVNPTSAEINESVSMTCQPNIKKYDAYLQRYNESSATYQDVFECTTGRANNCPDAMTWKMVFEAETTAKFRCYVETISRPLRQRASLPVTLIVNPLYVPSTVGVNTQTSQESTETTQENISTPGVGKKTTRNSKSKSDCAINDKRVDDKEKPCVKSKLQGNKVITTLICQNQSIRNQASTTKTLISFPVVFFLLLNHIL